MVHSSRRLSQKKDTFSGRHHLAATPHSRWSPGNIWPILNLPVSCRPALVQVVGANVLGVMVCPCPTSLPRFSPATAHIFPATLLRPDLLASLFTHAQPSLPVLLPLGAGIPLKCFAQLEADYSQSYQAVFRLLAWGDILRSASPGSPKACSDFIFRGRHPCCRRSALDHDILYASNTTREFYLAAEFSSSARIGVKQ